MHKGSTMKKTCPVPPTYQVGIRYLGYVEKLGEEMDDARGTIGLQKNGSHPLVAPNQHGVGKIIISD